MKKIPVAVLGATGMVGQKFVQLLAFHPWFEIVSLAASDHSVGKPFLEACKGLLSHTLPESIARMTIVPCKPNLPCRVVFSGLSSTVAGPIEENFARAGYQVISNSSPHRMSSYVPLVIPEVNPDHINLIRTQPYSEGCIVTNPNCSVIGLALSLKPLLDQFGLTSVHVVTLQALSGAGYPGVASIDILDNVIPHISGEEEKIESEPLKIFGDFQKDQIVPIQMQLSAHCNRVAVSDGHLGCVSVKLQNKACSEEMISSWRRFKGAPQNLNLPTAPRTPLHYSFVETHPQPKLHRHLNEGMTVSIGRLRECSLFDWKFVILSHNTVRGAAGCAILNAELMVKKGYIS